MPAYGIEVQYNQHPPIRCFSNEAGGISAHLYMAGVGKLQLDITVKTIRHKREYSLAHLVPGDVLTFRFLRHLVSSRQTIDRIERFKRKPIVWKTRPPFRLGLDVRVKTGDRIRTSHPKQGQLRFMLSNIPLKYARAFVMASDSRECWTWQFPDLHPNDEMTFHIVETDWCDAAPIVRKREA